MQVYFFINDCMAEMKESRSCWNETIARHIIAQLEMWLMVRICPCPFRLERQPLRHFQEYGCITEMTAHVMAQPPVTACLGELPIIFTRPLDISDNVSACCAVQLVTILIGWPKATINNFVLMRCSTNLWFYGSHIL